MIGLSEELWSTARDWSHGEATYLTEETIEDSSSSFCLTPARCLGHSPSRVVDSSDGVRSGGGSGRLLPGGVPLNY